jgi:hypothetical protein
VIVAFLHCHRARLSMNAYLTTALILFSASALAADQPADAKGALKQGANLPGTFLPYNATGPFRGRFHCLISDYGLEPTILLFVRDTDSPDSLNDLLKQIDARIDKNPVARLHAFAVFLTDNKTDLVTDNDKRDQLARKLEDLGNGLMLKHVVLCLDTPKDIDQYGLGEQWGLGVLYQKFRIISAHTLSKESGPEAEKLLGNIDEVSKAAKRR